MKISFKEVDKSNWREIASLVVGEQQSDFIEPNGFSITQSQFEPEWISVGVYDEDIPIGYAMHGIFEDDIWIDRYMIDRRFQGKGYGKAGFKAFMEYVYDYYQCSEVYLSFIPGNQLAEKMYKDLGFVDTGTTDEVGEIIMKHRKAVES